MPLIVKYPLHYLRRDPAAVTCKSARSWTLKMRAKFRAFTEIGTPVNQSPPSWRKRALFA